MFNFRHTLFFNIAVLILILDCSQSNQAVAEPASKQRLIVIDGDTLVLNNHQRVRLIGIDTPEIKDDFNRNQQTAEWMNIAKNRVDEFARIAKREAEEWIEEGDIVIELDPINAPINHRDKYNRLLAYVCRPSEETCLNEHLIKKGMGLVYRRFEFSKKPDYLESEKEAKILKRGLWKFAAP